MTTRKSLKRHVRARMTKTERYTAARRQLLARGEQPPDTVSAFEQPPDTVPGGEQPAETAPSGSVGADRRISDDVVRERTGRGREEWFVLLDEWQATTRRHGEIARRLTDEHGVGGWWAQSITVAYEQARGMRRPGEHPDGFAVSASKTVKVGIERLFEAFADDELRARWAGEGLVLRSARPPKRIRFEWRDPASRVTAELIARGDAKSTVALQHERLPDAASAQRMKVHWRQRVAELKALLES